MPKTNKLLMVEDEPIQREAFYQVLEDEIESKLYTLSFAESERAALNYIDKRATDLIVLDLALNTKADGFNVLRAIKEKKISTRSIVLTAHPQVENLVQALKLGVYDFISKPYRSDFIREKIKSAIAAAKMNRVTRNRTKMTFHQILVAVNQLSPSERFKIAEKLINALPKSTKKELTLKVEEVKSKRQSWPKEKDPLELDFEREDIVEMCRYKYGMARIEYSARPYTKKDGSVQLTGPYPYLRYMDGAKNVGRYLGLDHPAVKKDLQQKNLDTPPTIEQRSTPRKEHPIIRRIDEFVENEEAAIELVKALIVKYPNVIKHLKIN